tara:strand:- start:427 stop:630 length:204 start_codon:yes stop_codon:yes gene_type:complete
MKIMYELRSLTVRALFDLGHSAIVAYTTIWYECSDLCMVMATAGSTGWQRFIWRNYWVNLILIHIID